MSPKPEKKNLNAVNLGLVALALGVGYAGMRYQKKQQAKRWRDRLVRRDPAIGIGAPTPGAPSTALVTGASAGIGLTYAARLAGLGYRLVLVARGQERLEALAEELSILHGTDVEVLPADLSTGAGIARVETRVGAGDIDFLVNNAGYDVFGDFAQIPMEKNLALINCLELASVRLTRAALPGMLDRRRGAVVNLSSIGAFTPKRKDAIYVASKAFVNRFTESLALDLKGTGVRVQALCPGFTVTEFHDAPEYAQYRIKESIPAWLWMQPGQVVEESLQALGENRVVCVPGIKNQLIVAAAQSGLSQSLMGIMASFFPSPMRSKTTGEPALEILACPDCHGRLVQQGEEISCPSCAKTFPIVNGIPRFVDYTSLTGFDRRFAGLYDWFSIVYRLFSKVAFPFIGTTEDKARFEILDRLQPCGKVLEVSIGPGVNLPYLREYPAVREIYGLDISTGQIDRCRSYAMQQGWPVNLYQGNAEALPFQENTFDTVFHVGGINFFNDKHKAITEMIRVAKPGAKIIICDETERGARGYEVTLPGFTQSFKEKRETVRPPVDLIPPEMEEIRLDERVWNGWFYCIEFRKPSR
jgi:uncharacterized protein